MAKIKLKKVLNKKSEQSLIESIAINHSVAFEVFENNNLVYRFNRDNEKLSHVYELKYDENNSFLVEMSKENDILLNVIKYIIENEVEKKLLAQEILDKYKELTIFYQFSEKMARIREIEESANLAFQEAQKYIKATYCVLILVNEKGEKEKIFEHKVNNFGQDIELQSEFISKIVNEENSDIVNEVGQGIGKNIKSLIYSPIFLKDKVSGVFIMGNLEQVEYSSGDLKLLSAIAFLLGVSIENIRLYTTLEDTFFQTVRALSETIEKRDTYTGGHVQRVMEYSEMIGRVMGLGREELDKLKLAALMHDIGKIGIEDSILRKSNNLSDEEYWIMKKHTIYGAEIIQNVSYLKDIVPGVRGHHERYDGKGYPDGLQGDEIALYGRIIAVADTFDAMITDRPYRKGLSPDSALIELKKYAGVQFDPTVVDAFISSFQNDKNDSKIK